MAAESAASAASEGAETVPVEPASKPAAPETPAAAETPVPGEAVVPEEEIAPFEPAAEEVAAAGEAGEGATKGLEGKNTIWYIVGGAAFLGLIAMGLGGGGGGGGGGVDIVTTRGENTQKTGPSETTYSGGEGD